MKAIDTNTTTTDTSIRSMKAAGVTGVLRYLGRWPSGKGMSKAEADRIRAAGLSLAAIYESSAEQMLGGKPAGIRDANKAKAELMALGAPVHAFVWFCCDTEITASQMPTVMAYLDGAASVVGLSRTGVYGSYAVCKAALDGSHASKAWQTYAWSYKKWLTDPRCVLWQHNEWGKCWGTLSGLDYDANEVRGDFGAWGSEPVTPPVTPPEEEDLTTAAKVLSIAAHEVGTTESPANSNRVKYNSWAGLQGEPWCATLVAWCFDQAGALKLIGGQHPYTPDFAGWFKTHGQWHTTPKVGDVVFFDFPDSVNRIQHVGIVEKVSGSSITTIEGNTSSGSSGSQSNGGGVFRRTRSGSSIVGYGRPKYPTATVVPVPELEEGTVYRLNSGTDHLFTSSHAEAVVAQGSGYRYEGVAWVAKRADNSADVWRFFKDGHHMLTSDVMEGKAMVDNGWRAEGVAFGCADSTVQARPVHRFYHTNGDHFWTASETERDTVNITPGWKYEGVAFWVR